MISRKCLLLLFCLLHGLLSCSQTPNDNNLRALSSPVRQVIRDFELQLEKDVHQDELGSISAAIFIDRKIVWSKTFGWADMDKRIPADTATIYRTGSITKTITSFLMILLVQKGVIHLDDPVIKYVPELSKLSDTDAASITFRHLASNTSGLATEPNSPDAASGNFQDWEDKVILSIPAIRRLSAPGAAYHYSNIGYSILGLALGRAASKTYPVLVKEMILDPLQMNNSFFQIPAGKENKVAAGYIIDAFTGQIDAAKPLEEHKGRGYKVPTGGLYATANDLARFLMEQAHPGVPGALLTDSLSDMMIQIHTPESQVYGYGFGYNIPGNEHKIKIAEHDGGVAGYTAFMAYNPDYKVGIILLRNYDFGLTDILQRPRVTLYELCKAMKASGK